MEQYIKNDLLRAVIIFAVTAAIVTLINLLFRALRRRNAKLHVRFLGSILVLLVLIGGVYAGLSQFAATKDLGSSLIRGGTLIIAIATFAAQKALGNVISGFAISASRPFDIGDKVRILQGNSVVAEGLVTDMTIRHVVIEQFDGQSCIVPNSTVDDSVVINTNLVENVGNFLEFEIGFGSDAEKARAIIHDICRQEPLLVLKEKIRILTSRVSPNGLILKLTVWTKTLDDNFVACSNIRQRVVEEFLRCGIEIPYNTVTISNTGNGDAR